MAPPSSLGDEIGEALVPLDQVWSDMERLESDDKENMVVKLGYLAMDAAEFAAEVAFRHRAKRHNSSSR